MGKKRNKIRAAKRRDPSVNVLQLASCEGKLRYDTYEEAKVEAQLSFLRPYHCLFCRKYHKGKRPYRLRSK